jgi:hypothetical protein
MKSVCLAGALVFAHSCLAIAQVASLQITVIEGDAATYPPGARSPKPLTVQINDDSGRPVAGAPVNFRLPESGPGGVFANGLRTEIAITDANGRATVRLMHLNTTPGDFQIRVTTVKDQARAGTLLRQSIAGTAPASRQALMPKAKSGKKWILLGALAAGAAGGIAAGVASRSSVHPNPPATPTPAPPTVTIGMPTISVGRP